MGTVARMIARPEDVEDVAQEVFLKIYFSRDRLRAPELFEVWLHRITVNVVYTYLRRRPCREPRISDLPEAQMMLADAAAAKRSKETGSIRGESAKLWTPSWPPHPRRLGYSSC